MYFSKYITKYKLFIWYRFQNSLSIKKSSSLSSGPAIDKRNWNGTIWLLCSCSKKSVWIIVTVYHLLNLQNFFDNIMYDNHAFFLSSTEVFKIFPLKFSQSNEQLLCCVLWKYITLFYNSWTRKIQIFNDQIMKCDSNISLSYVWQNVTFTRSKDIFYLGGQYCDFLLNKSIKKQLIYKKRVIRLERWGPKT